mgnify:CR=1 FL=1
MQENDINSIENQSLEEVEAERQRKIQELNKKLEAPQKSGWKGVFWAIFLALFIRSCVVEPYNIPSSSLVPTLLIGDYLFITCFGFPNFRPFALSGDEGIVDIQTAIKHLDGVAR